MENTEINIMKLVSMGTGPGLRGCLEIRVVPTACPALDVLLKCHPGPETCPEMHEGHC